MKTALTFLFVGLLALGILLAKLLVRFDRQTIDLHWGDTYYVISLPGFLLIMVLLLATLFAAGGVAGTRLQNKRFLILFVLLLAADVLLISFG